MSRGVPGAGTKEMEEVKQAVKHDYPLSSLLKHPSFIKQKFKENNKTQERIFRNMYDFGAQVEWRIRIRDVSSYLDDATSKYQERLLNTTPLDCIIGYIIEDDFERR